MYHKIHTICLPQVEGVAGSRRAPPKITSTPLLTLSRWLVDCTQTWHPVMLPVLCDWSPCIVGDFSPGLPGPDWFLSPLWGCRAGHWSPITHAASDSWSAQSADRRHWDTHTHIQHICKDTHLYIGFSLLSNLCRTRTDYVTTNIRSYVRFSCIVEWHKVACPVWIGRCSILLNIINGVNINAFQNLNGNNRVNRLPRLRRMEFYIYCVS